MKHAYDNQIDADADREQQRTLITALNAWARALRRDECGAWRIAGDHGSIHTWGDGATWVLWVGCRSALHWTYTKQRLAFCAVTQDGDDEGCLRLHALPTASQAEEIRRVLGIRKRVQFTAEELARRRAAAAALNDLKPRLQAGTGA